jgi:hypothetical protein
MRTPRSANQADGAAQEGDRAGGGEIVEHLGVGQPGVIVDHHVHMLPAGDSVPAALAAGALLGCAAADHAVPGATDASQPLDVDVHELARVAALVAVGRLRRFQPRALPQADPLQPAGDG